MKAQITGLKAKIKSVCSRHVNLDTFFDQFFSVLSSLRNERDHATLMAIAKRRVISAPEKSPEWEYASLLTPYAFLFVQRQLSLRKKVVITDSSATKFTVSSSEGSLSVTANFCHCKFWKTMHLPCRHIFILREELQLPLFDPMIVSNRWKSMYMQEVFNTKKKLQATQSFKVHAVTDYVY